MNRTPTALLIIVSFISGLAVAAVPSTQSPYTAGATLTADKLNTDFSDIEARLARLERVDTVTVSASVANTGLITLETDDFLSACTVGGSINADCSMKSGYWASPPQCWVEVNGANALFTRVDVYDNAAHVVFYAENGASQPLPPFYIFCTGHRAP